MSYTWRIVTRNGEPVEKSAGSRDAFEAAKARGRAPCSKGERRTGMLSDEAVAKLAVQAKPARKTRTAKAGRVGPGAVRKAREQRQRELAATLERRREQVERARRGELMPARDVETRHGVGALVDTGGGAVRRGGGASITREAPRAEHTVSEQARVTGTAAATPIQVPGASAGARLLAVRAVGSAAGSVDVTAFSRLVRGRLVVDLDTRGRDLDVLFVQPV